MDPLIQYLEKNNFIPLINKTPQPKVGIIVVIPSFREPDLISSLNSLWICQRPICQVEVIIVINEPDNASIEIHQQNLKTLSDAQNWVEQHSDNRLFFYPVFVTLPEKHAGVGLARKTGMDEAVFRFSQFKKNEGIIVGFDADSDCSSNYLTEIEKHFNLNPKTPGASLYFEHPLYNNAQKEDWGIINYELHLRYLNQCLRLTGHPHAFQTVGSSFAVRSLAYVKQGGMNRKQAGEDFYFIQKIVALGNYSEINSTCIIPSSRESDRVPFGTGAAIKKWNNNTDPIYYTYNFEAFQALKKFFELIENFFVSDKDNFAMIIETLPESLKTFLISNNFSDEISQIQKHTATYNSFQNRFYNWFNIFKCIRYLNTAHETCYLMKNVTEMSKLLLNQLNFPISEEINGIELLKKFREIERSGNINRY
jgi:hypothetical protein